MNKYTLYSILIFPILAIILTTTLTLSSSHNSIESIENIYTSHYTEDYTEYSKKRVFNTVKKLEDTISYEVKNIESQLENDLKDKLEIALRIIQDIYNTNKSILSKEEMKKIAVERLDKLRFHNEEGYYYIFNSKTNNIIGHPIKELIGVNFTQHKDNKGKPTLGSFLEGLKSETFFFTKMHFYRPGDSIKQYPKLTGTVEFKELDLIIGTGEYLDNIEKNLKEQYIMRIRTISKVQNLNIYMKTDNGKFVNLLNGNIVKDDLSFILKKTMDKDSYAQYDNSNKIKESYFSYLENWGWIIESGFYVDETSIYLKKIKNEIDNEVLASQNKTKLILFVILFITFIVSFVFLNKLRRTIKKYTFKLNKYIKIIDKNVITSTSNINGETIDISDAYCKVSGYSKDEIISSKTKMRKDLDIPEKLVSEMWNTIEDEKVWKAEIKNTKKDASNYWVDVIVSPNMDEDNNLIGYTAIKQDITDKKRVEELSITDGLTSLYNRRYFDEIFPKALNGARREKEFFCFILMDIDHFKQYNDTYGHQKGDEVLIDVATCLKGNMKRANDLTFRLGGEEFGVLFKTDEKEKALIHANNLRNEIENLQINHEKNSASKYVTMSMGLICENAENLPSFDKVYRKADELLYKAKESGRNRVV